MICSNEFAKLIIYGSGIDFFSDLLSLLLFNFGGPTYIRDWLVFKRSLWYFLFNFPPKLINYGATSRADSPQVFLILGHKKIVVITKISVVINQLTFCQVILGLAYTATVATYHSFCFFVTSTLHRLI